MERGGGHEADDGGAVGVGDEAALAGPDLDVGHGFRVHLGDDERNLGVHPERRAIIHHHAAPRHRRRAEGLADGPAGAEESDVDAVEALLLELLDHVLEALEGKPAAGGALAGEHPDAPVGEIPVGDHAEELLPDGAGDADYRQRRSILPQGHPHAEPSGAPQTAPAVVLAAGGEAGGDPQG